MGAGTNKWHQILMQVEGLLHAWNLIKRLLWTSRLLADRRLQI